MGKANGRIGNNRGGIGNMVSFEHNGNIIANAELSFIPDCGEVVSIYENEYVVSGFRHEVKIERRERSMKKKVTEKIVCVVDDIQEEK